MTFTSDTHTQDTDDVELQPIRVRMSEKWPVLCSICQVIRFFVLVLGLLVALAAIIFIIVEAITNPP